MIKLVTSKQNFSKSHPNNKIILLFDQDILYANHYEKQVGKFDLDKLYVGIDYKTFIKDSTINTTTMIISRSILGTLRFRKINLEDYLFKCEILKNNNMAHKLNDITAFYRILDRSRSRKRLKSIYWLWYVNKNFNKLKFIRNIISIFFITINSIRKYGRIK